MEYLDKFDFFIKHENDDIIDENMLSQIIKLSYDDDSEIRCFAAKMLAKVVLPDSEKALVKLTTDTDRLVRAEACDSLSCFGSDVALKALLARLKDKSCLVRGYAALGVAEVSIKINSDDLVFAACTLKTMLSSETSEWSKIAVCCALVTLGIHSYFPQLISAIDSRYYKNRVFALNLIEQLIQSETINNVDCTLVLKAVRKKLETEKTTAVRQKLSDVLNEITAKHQ